jgi:hypothetical protein
MKWVIALLVALLVVVLLIALAPWQALETYWIVSPLGEVQIHWHQCLSAGGGSVILTNEQTIHGFIVENLSLYEPLLVTTCD